jgi:hypothetical protein
MYPRFSIKGLVCRTNEKARFADPARAIIEK